MRVNHDTLERLKVGLLADCMHPADGSVHDVIDKPQVLLSLFLARQYVRTRAQDVSQYQSRPGFCPPMQEAERASSAAFLPVSILVAGSGRELENEPAIPCVVRLRGTVDPGFLRCPIRAATVNRADHSRMDRLAGQGWGTCQA